VYTPFGAVTENKTVEQPFKFVGQAGVISEPNGFYYMKARYYDSTVNRFISEDPTGFGGGDVNLSAYVGNNPIMMVDPNGLSVFGKLWNLQNTVVGLTWGAIGMAFGDVKVTIGNNAIQFENHPFMHGGAITLGNTISYSSDFGPNTPIKNGTVGQHEYQHTIQGEQLGPLYLPSNILGLIAGVIINGDTHGPANWNERGPESTPPKPWGGCKK
jgi:RHS repeat-associated protein